MTGVSAPVLAQVDEITVTARRQEESLQDVPVSVTALAGEAIEARSLDDIVEFASSTPNLVATNGPQGSTDANLFIRGIGQFDFTSTNDPGVGVYVDGVYLGRTIGALLDVEDVERVEVLRGPQGTLFGRNTLGGAVSVVTKKPQLDEYAVSAEVTGGSRNRIDALATVNVPLGETAAFRVSALTENQDGPSQRVTDGTTFGDIERVGVKGTLLWAPTDRLEVVVRGDYARDRGSPNPVLNVGLNPNAFGIAPGSINPDAANDRSDDIYDSFQSVPAINDLDTWGGSITAEYDAGAVTLKSISAYRGLDANNWQDFDGTLFSYYDVNVQFEQEQFSQEFQVLGTSLDDRLDWIFGLYYFYENSVEAQDLCNPTLPPIVRGEFRCAVWDQDREQDVNAYAAFGQFSFDLTDRLSLTGGLRYTYEEKDFDTTQTPPFPFAQPFSVSASADFDDISPRAGIEYQAAEDVLVYFSYSQGFRSGGFNGRLLTPAGLDTYEPDINNTYEIGAKTELFDRRLRLNAAAFYTKYKDIQQSVTDPEVFFRITNAAEAEIKGFEIEATAAPTDNLLFDLGVGFTDSEFTEVDPGLAVSGVFEGNELAFAPNWTVNAGGQYTVPLGEIGNLRMRADYFYISEHFFAPVNSPLERQGGYGLLNLQVTWDSPDDRYSISAFGTNVTDEEYFVFGQDATVTQGVAYVHVGDPAEWGLRGAVRF
ncbi:MAG: TonB-dependent receptor [Pseudomonadota bacterium]